MMLRGLPTVALAFVLLMPGSVRAEVVSHMPPPGWGDRILPDHVRELPGRYSEQPVPPLPGETPESAKLPSERTGVPQSPHARLETGDDLGEMDEAARAVVKKARAGDFAEAAEAGRELLEKPRAAYDDFAWDLVGNATAWALVQQEDLQGAVEAHRAAARRIEDADVSWYHARMAAALEEAAEADGASPSAPVPDTPAEAAEEGPEPAADDEPAGAEDESAAASPEEADAEAAPEERLRNDLMPLARWARRYLAKAGSGKKISARLGYLEKAYEKMRRVAVCNPELAEPLVRGFRESVDEIARELIPRFLRRGEAERKWLIQHETVPMHTGQFATWNDEVDRLWTCVREVKRLVRVHNYLNRLHLAGDAKVDEAFDRAHNLLFVPGRSRRVWKMMGVKGGVVDFSRIGPAPVERRGPRKRR